MGVSDNRNLLGRRWTAEEDAAIFNGEKWSLARAKRLAAQLNRTEYAVIHHRQHVLKKKQKASRAGAARQAPRTTTARTTYDLSFREDKKPPTPAIVAGNGPTVLRLHANPVSVSQRGLSLMGAGTLHVHSENGTITLVVELE